MNALSLSWLPLSWWWPVAVLLSAALSAAAVAWLFFKQKNALSPSQGGHAAPVFAVFALLWWAFGFGLALWPLQGLDEFSQWARASSYVSVPLWIGGIAWVAALLVARLLGAIGRKR